MIQDESAPVVCTLGTPGPGRSRSCWRTQGESAPAVCAFGTRDPRRTRSCGLHFGDPWPRVKGAAAAGPRAKALLRSMLTGPLTQGEVSNYT
eukprot:gene8224-biopygen15145